MKSPFLPYRDGGVDVGDGTLQHGSVMLHHLWLVNGQ